MTFRFFWSLALHITLLSIAQSQSTEQEQHRTSSTTYILLTLLMVAVCAVIFGCYTCYELDERRRIPHAAPLESAYTDRDTSSAIHNSRVSFRVVIHPYSDPSSQQPQLQDGGNGANVNTTAMSENKQTLGVHTPSQADTTYMTETDTHTKYELQEPNADNNSYLQLHDNITPAQGQEDEEDDDDDDVDVINAEKGDKLNALVTVNVRDKDYIKPGNNGSVLTTPYTPQSTYL